MLTPLLLLACVSPVGKDPKATDLDGDSAATVLTSTLDTGPCAGTPPTLVSVTASRGEGVCEQVLSPTLELTAELEDPDGDLTSVKLQLWWDTDLDGEVTRNVGGVSTVVELPGERCSVPRATARITLCLDERLASGVASEWVVLPADAAGVEGEPFLLQVDGT